MITRSSRILLASMVAASLLIAGCSDDEGDDASGTTTAGVEISAEYEELCTIARKTLNASTSEQLELAEAQLEVAPDELRADMEAVVEFMRYREENPTDAAGITQRGEEISDAFNRALAAIQSECGIAAKF